MTVSTGWAAPDVAPMTGQRVWAIAGWPTGATMLGMICPAVNVCFVVGSSAAPREGVIASTADSGTNWTIITDPRSAFNEIVCPSSTHCYVVTGRNHVHHDSFALTVTHDGGTSWRLQPLTSGAGPVDVACAGVTTCVLWGDAVPGTSPSQESMLTTRDGGKTWKASRTVAQSNGMWPPMGLSSPRRTGG